MAAKIYKINFKSDFVLTIQSDAGWAIPFCIKFWTGMPAQAYFAGFNGKEYRNCRMGDTPDKLIVLFDDHHLPIGELKMQIAYHTTIEEFPTVVMDEVTNAQAVKTDIDGEEHLVVLDFTGETAPEIEFSLPAYYNEQQRIENELQRQENELQRQENELARQEAEIERERATAAAVEGAERVNAQLDGTILTVTNRNGESTSSNVQGPVGPPGRTVQSDWSQDNPSADDYIKNKPDIYTKQQTDGLLGQKQELLSSGTNIKTINGNSILGSGNLNIRETYVAVRGTTTLQQIKDAFDANKFVIVYGKYMDDENVQRDACFSLTKFSYTNNSRTTAHFFAPISKYRIAEVRCTASGWSDNYYSRLQDANNITDDVASNYSQSNKFPSTKGVYDFVQQAGFITKSVDDLVNYYLKSDTYTKSEVQQLIDAVKQFAYEVVQTLPQASADTMGKIYLVPSSDPQAQNIKDEYITIDNGQEAQTRYTWEKIGSTDIDLSGYVTTSALNEALAAYTTTTDLTTLLAAKQDVIDDLSTIRSGAAAGATAVQPAAIANMEVTSNKVTAISDQSTNTQYPSAKAVYDFVGGALSKYVEHGTDDTTFMLTPNCFHIWGEVAALTLTLPSLLLPGYEFVFQFTSGATATALSLPSSLKWFTAHTVKDRMLYQVRILNGCASMQGVDISLAGDPYVDLGLPSGVKWAKRNIDVTRDSGFTSSDYEYDCSFFSWGNIDGHNPTSDSSFSPWDWGGVNGSEPYYEGQVYGSTPGNTLTGNIPVGAEYDAARAILGSPWRMPTSLEYQELFDNTNFLDANGDVIPASTTNKCVTIEGIVGIKLASKINGNELFFPCSGFGYGTSRNSRGSSGNCWSSTWLSARNARLLNFSSGGVYPQNYNLRYFGFAVRAVQ